jgi:hypothetical protein
MPAHHHDGPNSQRTTHNHNHGDGSHDHDSLQPSDRWGWTPGYEITRDPSPSNPRAPFKVVTSDGAEWHSGDELTAQVQADAYTVNQRDGLGGVAARQLRYVHQDQSEREAQ